MLVLKLGHMEQELVLAMEFGLMELEQLLELGLVLWHILLWQRLRRVARLLPGNGLWLQRLGKLRLITRLNNDDLRRLLCRLVGRTRLGCH